MILETKRHILLKVKDLHRITCGLVNGASFWHEEDLVCLYDWPHKEGYYHFTDCFRGHNEFGMYILTDDYLFLEEEVFNYYA